MLNNGVDIRFKEILSETLKEKNAELIELEVMDDHVHLLVEVDPQFVIHKLIKLIKGKSLRLLRKEFPSLPTLWSNSYFVSTVGDFSLSKIKQYIENQKHV